MLRPRLKRILLLIAGYVFDISDSVKLKPASMLKVVRGSNSIGCISQCVFQRKNYIRSAYRLDLP